MTLPYPPSANRLWRHAGGRVIQPAEVRAWKRAAGLLAIAAGLEPAIGPVSIRLRVYRPRKSGDLDNRIKAVLDALNGVAWDDDDQVVEIHATRHEDAARPRVEVEIETR